MKPRKYLHYYVSFKTDEWLKPVRIESPSAASARTGVILDATKNPPREVSSGARWVALTTFDGLLPDQWIDFEGNLRNSQGRLVFAA